MNVPNDLTFVYFTPADIQVPRVDRQAVVHFCESLYRLGVDLQMVTLRIELLESEIRSDNPLDLYRIKTHFPVRMVPTQIHQRTQDTYRTGLARIRAAATEGRRCLREASGDRRLLFYVKNYGPALLFIAMRALTRKKLLLFFESHTLPKRALQRWVLRRFDGIIANSNALGRDLVAHAGLAPERVLGTHQGIDLDLVEESRLSKEEARERLGIPSGRKIIVYAGKIYWGYREVEHILDAAKLCESDAELLMVGGRADHVERYRERLASEGIGNVRFTGFVAPIDVQHYLAAADLLVMYYPTGIELNKYRSPGKLFEYMAAGRPIITADYPVLHEILGDDPTAVLVPPDSPAELAQAIDRALSDEAAMEAMAKRALERVRLFSWEERARRIMEFVEERSVARR